MDERKTQGESSADRALRKMAFTDSAYRGPEDSSPSVRSYVLAIIGTVGLVYCLTAMWIGMRDVMEVGGSCASGNSPYAIETPCPEGSALLIAPSAPLGFLFGAMMAYGLAGIARGAASLVVLFWPALFISLGYNFLEGAINPPGGGSLDVGFLVCGILFMAMGIPVLFALPMLIRDIRPRRPLVLSICGAGAVGGILLAMWVADAVS